MKIIAISDIHGNKDVLPSLESLIKSVRGLAFIAFTGDVVKASARKREWIKSRLENRRSNRNAEGVFEEETADREQHHDFYTFLSRQRCPSYIIPGNMDSPEKRLMSFIDKIEDYRTIRFVHRNTLSIDEFSLAGFGGGIGNRKETYFQLIYPSETVRYGFRKLKYTAGRKIIMFHVPPYNVLDASDEVESGHLGAQVVNDVIESIKPELVLCGHAHQARGVEEIDGTTVVNPGALMDGSAAVIDMNKLKVRFVDL